MYVYLFLYVDRRCYSFWGVIILQFKYTLIDFNIIIFYPCLVLIFKRFLNHKAFKNQSQSTLISLICNVFSCISLFSLIGLVMHHSCYFPCVSDSAFNCGSKMRQRQEWWGFLLVLELEGFFVCFGWGFPPSSSSFDVWIWQTPPFFFCPSVQASFTLESALIYFKKV